MGEKGVILLASNITNPNLRDQGLSIVYLSGWFWLWWSDCLTNLLIDWLLTMLLTQTNQQDDHMNDWLTVRLIKKKPYLTSLKSGYLLGVLITDLSSLTSFAGEFDLTKYLTFEYVY